MNVDEIKQALEFPGGIFPRKAVEAAIQQPEAITPLLLQTLQDVVDDPQSVNQTPGYWLHIFALYLLAQFREPRAYPLMLQLFSLPGRLPRDILGDVVTESAADLLASVWDGDLRPLQEIIENPAGYEYCRAAGLTAMLTLVRLGKLERDTFIDYLRTLFDGGLEREPSFVWNDLVLKAEMMYVPDLLPQIRQAFADGLCDPFCNRLEDVEKTLSRDQDEVLAELSRERGHLIDDTVGELEGWASFQPKRKPGPRPAPNLARADGQPVVKAPKVGRNDPCPCGSGKKYKKCCLNKAASG